ncbi:tripartite tricarboxylate transporter permease [Halalkalibacter krulwichiae]|uniref:Tripartite tricarboxylate transporter TctA family protein n=1 Tax=Halalkalibacter krulwichiae TaxID=199441 RepID=A0A1X9M9Q5_9BACI|nr:tripartite tricarboxylate transporter permease [Halalkalibacter krulwichiae]ARK30189.1 Tripartite tricarboxylate transporter TctA family protein [Halalkalibacter krulwichiae]
MFDLMVNSLLALFDWAHLLALVAGVTIGMFLGSIPGLSGTLGLALMVPFTYNMPLTVAVVLLTATYKASSFSGSLSSIMLGTPGTPAAAATMFDGYKLFKKGKGWKAIQMSIYSSATADLLTDILLLLAVAPMALLALMFGPPEFLILVALALLSVASISETKKGSLIKNIISGLIGLFIAMIGMEALAGSPRYTFGSTSLLNGIDIMIAVLGLLCLPEVFMQISQKVKKGKLVKVKDVGKEEEGLTFLEYMKALPSILRGTIVGAIIGILPGAGPSMGAFMNYQMEHSRSKSRKDKVRVGEGSLRGVAAAESGNSAVGGANLIPMFSFGIPGDAAAAILIGAFVIHGVTPGPMIMERSPDIVYTAILGLIIANLILIPIALLYSKMFKRIINKIDASIIYPIVLVICLAAAYTVRQSMLDLAIIVILGLLGILIIKAGFSRVAIIIGLILGGLTEQSFGQTLMIGKGSLFVVFDRPISLVLLTLVIIFLLWSLLSKAVKARSESAKKAGGIEQ